MASQATIKTLSGMESLHFEIPKYQRAYSWEKEHWGQFLDDLKDAECGYYLGHFLFESDDDSKYFVIDGQQRLTTCVIVSGKPAPMSFQTQSAQNLVEAKKFFSKELNQLDADGIFSLIHRLENAVITTFEVAI